jgi:methylenetetrahydrofolate reductase (NADPH)
MKVIEHIPITKKTLFSFEILPPIRGGSIEIVFDTLDSLMEFSPPFIHVTYHRYELSRQGTIGSCVAVTKKYNVETVPHLLSSVFDNNEDTFMNLQFLGIENLFLLRGDSIKCEIKKLYALDLLKQVPNKSFFNKFYFCIGIAGYPEKHFESPNPEMDLHYLNKKIEAGANYIITQMFFDNKKYFEFVKICREKGISVPIIPGIKPIYCKYHLKRLPYNFYVSLPNELVKEVKNEKYIEKIGIEWSIKQSKELKDSGVEVIHYYTMDRTNNIGKIIKMIY